VDAFHNAINDSHSTRSTFLGKVLTSKLKLHAKLFYVISAVAVTLAESEMWRTERHADYTMGSHRPSDQLWLWNWFTSVCKVRQACSFVLQSRIT